MKPEKGQYSLGAEPPLPALAIKGRGNLRVRLSD